MSDQSWTAADLDRIGTAEEMDIAPLRPDGSLRPYVTIWMVRAGDELYVRSAHGPENGWFRRARAAGAGRIRVAGVEDDVTFADAADGPHAAIDAAYRQKYAAHPQEYVTPVIGDAAPNTLRLVPRS